MDTTWESPPSRRPESIRLDSHIGGGIEFDNVSESNSSDIFGNDSYEYKVATPQGGFVDNNNNHDRGDIYIRNHPNTNDMNDYTVHLKPPNMGHNGNGRNIMHHHHQPDPNNNIFGKNSNNIGTIVEHNGRTVRYVNVNDLINKIGFG